MRRFLMCLAAALALGAAPLAAESATDGLTPQQLLVQARSMFPRERLTVKGALVTAKARGLEETERPYTLDLDWAGATPTATCALFLNRGATRPLLTAEMTRAGGTPALTLVQDDGTRVEGVNLNTPIGESDLTWVDMTFDYLWWTNVRRLSDAEIALKDLATRQSGRSCLILEAKPAAPVQGLAAVRLWVDEGTGLLMQTEQLDAEGNVTRQMYVQRLGRENGRWVPREFRVRRIGMERVTKLTVWSVKSDSFSTEEDGHE